MQLALDTSVSTFLGRQPDTGVTQRNEPMNAVVAAVRCKAILMNTTLAEGPAGIIVDYEFPTSEQERYVVLYKQLIANGSLVNCDPDARDILDIVRLAVMRDGKELQHVSPRLQNHTWVVFDAVCQTPHALQWAGPIPRDNTRLVRTAVTENGETLEDASPRLQGDRAIVVIAARQHPHALKHASQALQNDPSVRREAGIVGTWPCCTGGPCVHDVD